MRNVTRAIVLAAVIALGGALQAQQPAGAAAVDERAAQEGFVPIDRLAGNAGGAAGGGVRWRGW